MLEEIDRIGGMLSNKVALRFLFWKCIMSMLWSVKQPVSYTHLRIPDIKEKDETFEQKEKREHKLKSLNALCVRIVFCLYAEDAGIFGKRNMFHDYLETYEVKDCRRALLELFKILDTPVSERDEYLEEELAQFPYVNGGLFADETIEIPPFTCLLYTSRCV